MSKRVPLLYVAHPVGSSNPNPIAARDEVAANLDRVERWIGWLQVRRPNQVFIAPYIHVLRAGAEDDADPAQRKAGLERMCAVVQRCDGIVLVGGRSSPGMLMETLAAIDANVPVIDLIHLGAEPPIEGENLNGFPVDNPSGVAEIIPPHCDSQGALDTHFSDPPRDPKKPTEPR